MADVIALGELLIDFVATVSGVSLMEAPAFQKAPGGAPANVAVGLARLGVPSGFMGKVGADPFGYFLAETLSQAGVDISTLRYSGEARTALAFVSLRADGERDFMFYRHPSADMLFSPGDVDAEAIRSARVLHFGSISLIGEPSRSATRHAINLAREAGLLISYDPNLRLNLWPSAEEARSGILDAWSLADLIKISEEELAFLTGDSDPFIAGRRLWHPALRLLVITRGKDGCSYLTPSFEGHVPGFSVQVVDTTGAGDGFVAGLLRNLVRDAGVWQDESGLRRACRFANAVGALTTTCRGAIPALPTLEQVEDLLAASPQ